MSLFRFDAEHSRRGIRPVARSPTSSRTSGFPATRGTQRGAPTHRCRCSFRRTALATVAVSGGIWPPAADRTPEQQSAVALSCCPGRPAGRRRRAALAVPLYNFGVSQHFKSWVDLVLTDPRMALGDPSATGQARRAGHGAWRRLRRGHAARGLGPRHRLDAANPRRRVGTGPDNVVEREFTLVGVNPALDQFREPGRRAPPADRVQRAYARAQLADRFVRSEQAA